MQQMQQMAGNISPEQIRQAQQQMAGMTPEQMRQAQQQMGSMGPEQMASAMQQGPGMLGAQVSTPHCALCSIALHYKPIACTSAALAPGSSSGLQALDYKPAAIFNAQLLFRRNTSLMQPTS